MIAPSRKFKFVLKFNIESNIKTLNTKISTILSQKRINSSDFLLLLKEKLNMLNIREDANVLKNNLNLKINLMLFFIKYLKMNRLFFILLDYIYI